LMAFARTYFKQYNKYKNEKQNKTKTKNVSKLMLIHLVKINFINGRNHGEKFVFDTTILLC
jgi:hypothetical protein